MRLRCAILDFDGTLFDSMYIWDSVGETYLCSLGREPKPAMREALKPMSLGQSARYLQREYGLSLSVEEIRAGINRTVARFYAQEILPKPGVEAFLQRLREAGIASCIATATDRPLIQAALRRCGMERYFDAIFTCGELGHGKDEPIIFRAAMDHFAADRASTVVLEDALHAAQTAKADGFAVAAVYDGNEKRQEALRALADCYLPDYAHTEDFWSFALAESAGAPGGILGAPPYAAE